MKTYLHSITNQLKNYTLSLSKTSLLIDKPWALLDEKYEMQKLIFKKNKELILSQNGQVQIGKWDYFPEAKSLLIDRISDKILCNEAFIDEGVLVLKIDGTKNDYFILANENIIPDLDANTYLKAIRNKKLNILEEKLLNGNLLEIHREGSLMNPTVGNSVTIHATIPLDGKYQLDGINKLYEVNQGRISKIIVKHSYTNPDGLEITIHQQQYRDINYGDDVYVFGKPMVTTTLNFSNSKNLIVRDGKVVRLERKNGITRFLSKCLKILFNDYHK